MKFILALSSLTLVSFCHVSPCLAASQSTQRDPSLAPQPSSSQPLSSQPLSSQPQSIRVAGFFDTIRDSVDQVLDTVDRVEQSQAEQAAREQAEQERQRRLDDRARQQADRARQQAELEEAQKAATEEQRLEAERRRQHVESLSPADREAYLAQQRAEQDAAAQLLLLMFFGMGGGTAEAPSENDPARDAWERDREAGFSNPPAAEPAPAPVEPIGGWDGLYGDGPG
jgi:TolA-binding protein